jgi:hypothetical protein
MTALREIRVKHPLEASLRSFKFGLQFLSVELNHFYYQLNHDNNEAAFGYP